MNEWDIALQSFRTHGRAIAAGIVFGLFITLFTVVFQRPIYQAEMVIAPTERTGVPSLGSILPQGMSDTPVLQYFVSRIDAAQSSDFTTFETLVTSPRLARHLIEKGNLSLPRKSSADLAEWIQDHVRIRPVGTTPFRKITLRSNDPALAISLLDYIFQETDMMIRRDARMKTQRRITYLKDQLSQTKHPDHKDAIVALLKEQEQTAMMVSIDNYFAAEPVYTPALAPRPVAPDWRILLPTFGFGGAIIGFMMGGFLSALRRPSA